MRIRFHFRLIPFIVTVVLVALGISLAQWQTRRAEQKLQLEAQLIARSAAPAITLSASIVSADEVEFRRVTVRGEFVREWPVYLDNRPQNGRPGFYVVMPFRIAGSAMNVLVQRGWMPLNRADRNQLMAYPTPTGEITISGIARRHATRVMQFAGAVPVTPRAIVQNLHIDELAQAAHLSLQPILIEQTTQAGDAPDGLIRDWPAPSSGVDQHRGYAFQWYALALMALLFFVVTGINRNSTNNMPANKRDQVQP